MPSYLMLAIKEVTAALLGERSSPALDPTAAGAVETTGEDRETVVVHVSGVVAGCRRKSEQGIDDFVRLTVLRMKRKGSPAYT